MGKYQKPGVTQDGTKRTRVAIPVEVCPHFEFVVKLQHKNSCAFFSRFSFSSFFSFWGGVVRSNFEVCLPLGPLSSSLLDSGS